MKSLLTANWYKVIMGLSAIMLSFAAAVFALKYNSVYAHTPLQKVKKDSFQETVYVVAVGNKIYEVKKNGEDYDTNFIRQVR